MFVRLTFCKFFPDRIAEAKRIFRYEITPMVQRQKGNLKIHLLEPSNSADDFISITEWRTKADAEAYENSGLYQTLVNKFDGMMMKEPVLRTYLTEDQVITAFEQW